jgi:hypothetical protein
MPPPLPSDAGPRPPADFASVLATPEPLFLVGGQAVNLWALYYRERTSDLAPFVSRDADVLGDRDTLAALGKLCGVKPQFFPRRPPGNEVGVIIASDTTGAPLLVEVLRSVRGATNEQLREPVYQFALGGQQVRVDVPGPIALLQAKLANLVELNQTGRQDGRHILILARVLPAYLEDLVSAVRQGRTVERKLVDLLEQLLAVLASPHGRKACAGLELNPSQFFAQVTAGGLPKISSFLTKRLPRALTST